MPRGRNRTTRAIYVIKHKPTGKFYIDVTQNLEAAWDNWKAALKGPTLPAIVPSTNPDEYELRSHRLPDELTQSQVTSLRTSTLRDALKKDTEGKMINRLDTPPIRSRGLVATINGEEIPLVKLAQDLGINYITLVKRHERGLRDDKILQRQR